MFRKHVLTQRLRKADSAVNINGAYVKTVDWDGYSSRINIERINKICEINVSDRSSMNYGVICNWMFLRKLIKFL